MYVYAGSWQRILPKAYAYFINVPDKMDISILRAGLNDSFDPYTDPGGIRELMLPKPNGLDICMYVR